MIPSSAVAKWIYALKILINVAEEFPKEVALILFVLSSSH